MDTARAFTPSTILLWRPVADDPEARRILEMFPAAELRIVETQRGVAASPGPGRHPVLAGKRVLMIGHASLYLRRFDGCLGAGVHCSPYLKLVPVSNGCPYFCTYCYLAPIYQDRLPLIKININHGRMFKEIREAVLPAGRVVPFNMGEMLDSLALDHVTLLTERLVPFFSGVPNGCLMLLTKSANVEGLLQVKAHPQVVVSWSLNTQRMIEACEIGTASLDERLRAARRCQEHGYRIRLRIDPGILYSGWEMEYADLIGKSLAVLSPENITLGMLRFLRRHLGLAREAYGRRADCLHMTGLSDRAPDGKLRYPATQRVQFYRHLVDVVRSIDEDISIGLCRETNDVWNDLRSCCNPHECNCLSW